MLEFTFIACGLVGGIGLYLLAAKMVLWIFGFAPSDPTYF